MANNFLGRIFFKDVLKMQTARSS